MKMELINKGKGFEFIMNGIKEQFKPVKITTKCCFIKKTKIAYPTKDSFVIYNGDTYVLFVDKYGENFNIHDCLQFTKFNLLQQTY